MTLNKILKWTALGAIFTTPFALIVVSNSLYFPYVSGKHFVFRVT